MSVPVHPLGPTRPGPPRPDEKPIVALFITPSGDVDWWIDQYFGNTMSAALATELVAIFEDFLADFIRERG